MTAEKAFPVCWFGSGSFQHASGKKCYLLATNFQTGSRAIAGSKEEGDCVDNPILTDSGGKIMGQAKAGDKVIVHYTGSYDDGTVFDSSMELGPLEVTIGTGMVIPGFDRALLDMEPGQKKMVNIPVEEAYGPRIDDLVAVVGRERIPADIPLEIGQQLQLSLADGGEAIVLIVDLTDETVTLDANHPMAGLDLNFELELVEIL